MEKRPARLRWEYEQLKVGFRLIREALPAENDNSLLIDVGRLEHAIMDDHPGRNGPMPCSHCHGAGGWCNVCEGDGEA